MRTKLISTLYSLVVGVGLIGTWSCEDFIRVDPPKTQIISSTVYKDDLTAETAIRGVYNQMITGTGFASGGASSVTMLCGLSADEFVNHSTHVDRVSFAGNDLHPANPVLANALWGPGYRYIYYANALLEGLEASNQVSGEVKRTLEGEARFIRAFCHFYLTNLFGDIPLIETTDYNKNKNVGRMTSAEVMEHVTADLLIAKSLLPEMYPTEGRVRVNKWAATALLARVYLYQGDWLMAEEQATQIINVSDYYEILDDLDAVFLKNSREAIWQLMPVSTTFNTREGNVFVVTSRPQWVSISDQLLNTFSPEDSRLTAWVGSVTTSGQTYHFPFKYKIRTGADPLNEYSMVLRLAEQYLIRAEARIHLANIGGALEDLNKTRNRAGLPDLTVTDEATLLQAVITERQLELFSEWGHRWFDLKRTDMATGSLAGLKAGFQETDTLYPIPQSERALNPLLTQNFGY